jgi:glycine hydroxymethyltransferase
MSRIHHYLEKTPKEKLNTGAVAYLAALDHIEATHPLIANTIIQELKDQRSYLKLIASENYSSLAVQLAMGNLMTDKYAEGYAFHRFYAGCDNVDIIEDAAQQELKSLFGAEYASVQPHSGADANLLAMWAILVQRVQNPEIEKLGKKSIDELTPEEHEKLRHHLLSQKVMGLSLNSGGHLTHGYRHNISSKIMKSVLYDVDPKTELLDYKVLADLAKREKPDIIMAGYSAHSRKLNFAKFREIADSVGAVLMADIAHFSGLVAGKAFEGEFNPLPYAQMVTSTTHKTLRGPRGGMILCTSELGEIVNKGCPMVMGGPLPHVMAAKAVAFKEANTPEFREYTKKIIENAQALSKSLMDKGLRIVSGATENHLMVVDISSLGLTGRHAESALRKAGLTINRNAIPFDANGPWYTSGIRLGTPAMTTLGMGAAEMGEIADIIVDVLKHTKPATAKTGQPSKANSETDEAVVEKSKRRVKSLLSRFPLYPEIEIA